MFFLFARYFFPESFGIFFSIKNAQILDYDLAGEFLLGKSTGTLTHENGFVLVRLTYLGGYSSLSMKSMAFDGFIAILKLKMCFFYLPLKVAQVDHDCWI